MFFILRKKKKRGIFLLPPRYTMLVGIAAGSGLALIINAVFSGWGGESRR